MSEKPSVTIVIATRNRPRSLRTCLDAIDGQLDVPDLQVVIVDDGSVPPLDAEVVALRSHQVDLVRLGGAGPSAARNAGVAKATGDVLLFTDDDTIPTPIWADSARAPFSNPHVVAVEGPVTTRAFDPLREHSFSCDGPHHYWTCNVAYRKSAFAELGGFDEVNFPRYREDRDLGCRAARMGRTTYADDMSVEHVPRAISPRDHFRAVKASVADIELERRHPEAFPAQGRGPRFLRPLVAGIKRSLDLVRKELQRGHRPRVGLLAAFMFADLAASAYVSGIFGLAARHPARATRVVRVPR